MKNIGDYEFYILRGAAENAEPRQHVDIDGTQLKNDGFKTTDVENIKVISKAIDGADYFEFIDYTPALKNLWPTYKYQISVRLKATGEEMLSAPFDIDQDLDLVGLYIAQEMDFLLEDTIGSPSFVYRRRRAGIQCTVCFDPIQKRRITSSCYNCYGTNFVGGFYQPVDTYVNFEPTANSPVIQEWGETQDNATNIQVSSFPLLSPGDLIRELRNNRLWRVVKVNQAEKRRAAVIQFAQVVEIKPEDIENKLPYDLKLVRDKLDYYNKQRQLREF